MTSPARMERPSDANLLPSVAARHAYRSGTAASTAGVANGFVQGNLAEPVRGTRFGAVVANLPYVPTSDLPRAPAPASFEPRAALDGGADGLALYRELMPQLPALLEDGANVWLEAAPPTIEVLVAIARGTFATSTIEARNDYGGRPRFVSIRPSRPA